MNVLSLASEKVPQFVAYCRKHKPEVDESFLYDDDLARFLPDGENPTYVLVDPQGEIRGVASLMIDDYNRRGRRARFRILHSETGRIEHYEALMQALMKHSGGLDRFIVFVGMTNPELAGCVERLGFVADRYSYVLLREDVNVPEPHFPPGYDVRPFIPGKDEEAWCAVRNAAFATLRGAETPITADTVAKIVTGEGYLDGGMMILFHGATPIGVVAATADEYGGLPAMEIGPLAVIPQYQGKGLGRGLLRVSVRFAQDRSYNRTVLCVNAENERAKTLYIHEGFKQVEATTCYRYELFAATGRV